MSRSCSRYPRIARGIAGAVVGGVLGRILVSALGIGEMTQTQIGPTGVPSRVGVASYSIPLMFAVSGAVGAAWQKDC